MNSDTRAESESPRASVNARWLFLPLAVFIFALGLLIGAVTLGVYSASSTWRQQRRETNEALLLQQTRTHDIEARAFGNRTALLLEDASAASEHTDRGLGIWIEYAAIVEEGFIEACLPGLSVESITEAMELERRLEIRLRDNGLTSEEEAELVRLDAELADIPEELEADVFQLMGTAPLIHPTMGLRATRQ